ncbi:MAG: hypothetical protein AB7G11_13105 [Phycisphaerales bacterium]
MAEKETKAEKPAEGAATDAPKKKKGGMKVIIGVAGAMAIEGAVLFFVLGSGGPQKSEAAEQSHDLAPDASMVPEELLVVEDKFQNLQTGRVWVWDAAIYVQVMSRDKSAVEEILKRRAATIKEGISQIFSRSQHAQLAEPERQTLNRQISTFLDQLMQEEQKTIELVGSAAAGESGGHGGGESHGAAPKPKSTGASSSGKLIQRVLIPKCRGFPTDF